MDIFEIDKRLQKSHICESHASMLKAGNGYAIITKGTKGSIVWGSKAPAFMQQN